MADLGNTSIFSQNDASNGSGSMPSWLGSAAPSTLDDAGRALQGAVTREWNWRNYTLTAGGTADAKTLTYSVAPAAYYNGQRFAFIANTVNTTTVTLNVNALGAKTIKKMLGGTATNLAAGEMPAGAYVEVAYNTVGDYFVWLNSTLPIYSDSSGNVGLGTSTPTDGNIHIHGGSGSAALKLTNTATGQTITDGFYVGIESSAGGAFIFQRENQPITFGTNNTSRAILSASGDFIVTGSGGLGYGTGSGGSVTQLTSKATGVTLNKTNGVITMNNAALAAGATVSFVVTNSVITLWDTVVVKPSNGNYRAHVTDNTNGQFTMIVTNISGGSLSEAVQIAFTILRTVAA